MKQVQLRRRIACGAFLLLTFPFLTGADDEGCRPGGSIPVGSGNPPDAAGGGDACVQVALCVVGDVFDSVLCQCVPKPLDGGDSDSGACVSQQGAHCGGNTTHPCTCAPGLACMQGDSGLPFGDVGGTCERANDAGCVQTVLCVVGDVFDPMLCRCVPKPLDGGDTDSGACVSQQGGHCGGNTTHPCTCAPGLACTPGDSGLPFGDVGGTCEPASDAGCVQTVLCVVGDVFDPVLCQCVPKPLDAGACQSAADCRGTLPLVCQVCADGGDGCAHWTCPNGQCVSALCD